jgi:hypothetical protein
LEYRLFVKPGPHSCSHFVEKNFKFRYDIAEEEKKAPKKKKETKRFKMKDQDESKSENSLGEMEVDKPEIVDNKRVFEENTLQKVHKVNISATNLPSVRDGILKLKTLDDCLGSDGSDKPDLVYLRLIKFPYLDMWKHTLKLALKCKIVKFKILLRNDLDRNNEIPKDILRLISEVILEQKDSVFEVLFKNKEKSKIKQKGFKSMTQAQRKLVADLVKNNKWDEEIFRKPLYGNLRFIHTFINV